MGNNPSLVSDLHERYEYERYMILSHLSHPSFIGSRLFFALSVCHLQTQLQQMLLQARLLQTHLLQVTYYRLLQARSLKGSQQAQSQFPSHFQVMIKKNTICYSVNRLILMLPTTLLHIV